MLSLAIHQDPNFLPARHQSAILMHPLPAHPLPTDPSRSPAQLGREGTPPWRHGYQVGGGTSLAALPKTEVAAASSKFSGDLLHHSTLNSLPIPKASFSSFCRTELTQEAGEWGLRSSHVGRGDGNKTSTINYCPQRATREVSLAFPSCFQKPPGDSGFSDANLEKYQSNLIF